MRNLVIALAALVAVVAALMITGCSPAPTAEAGPPPPPKLDICPYGRDFAYMSNEEQDAYFKEGCTLEEVCPSTAGKSGRRFARRLDYDRVVRLKEIGCPITDRLQRRLDAGA